MIFVPFQTQVLFVKHLTVLFPLLQKLILYFAEFSFADILTIVISSKKSNFIFFLEKWQGKNNTTKMDAIKTIENFQFPMDSGSTPYNTCEFSPEVEEICDAEKAFLSALHDSSWENATNAEAATKQINASRSRLRIAKCIVVGDTSVGKTCLVHRLVDKIYANNLKATTGVDFEVQKYQILGRPFTLQVSFTLSQNAFA